MSYANILLKQIEPGVYSLQLNRPKALNALSSQTIDELRMAVTEIGNDTSARVLLITGAGEKAFAAGADIEEMRDFAPFQAQAFSQKGIQTLRMLESLPIPVIAVVRGYCLGGGCELAMCCDWIVASDDAVFGQPEVGLGIPPGFGGNQRLSRRVGANHALELITTGRHVEAREAKEIGLVNHLYPVAELLDEALNMARLIASNGPIAVRLAKQAVRSGRDMDLDSACALDSMIFGLAFSSEDQSEGMKAFLEKRKPAFRNQ